MQDRRLAIAVGLLLVLMLVVAWWAAGVQASLMQQWLAAGGVPFPGNPWTPFPLRNDHALLNETN